MPSGFFGTSFNISAVRSAVLFNFIVSPYYMQSGLPARFILQGHALFKDSHIMETCFLRFYLAAGSNLQHIAKQFLCQFFLCLILDHTACVKIDPVILVACKLGITGNLYSRNRGCKGCAAAGCKEHHMGAGHSQSRSCREHLKDLSPLP